MKEVDRFNIRVYGLLFHGGSVLVSDEMVQGRRITKFPGGGMMPGEGTLDCLRREIREEIGQEAGDLRHFYTTDFFQRSAFRPEDQIISIYYSFSLPRPDLLGNGLPAPGTGAEPGQVFRWLPLGMARVEDVDLPIDRVVMRMVLDGLKG